MAVVDAKPVRTILFTDHHYCAGPGTRRWLDHSCSLHSVQLLSYFLSDHKRHPSGRASLWRSIASVNVHLHQVRLSSLSFLQGKGCVVLLEEIRKFLLLRWCESLQSSDAFQQLLLSPGSRLCLDPSEGRHFFRDPLGLVTIRSRVH